MVRLVTHRRLSSSRIGVLAAVAWVGACHGASRAPSPAQPAVHRTITAGGLDSVPMLTVTEGRLVCLAAGQSPCPVDVAAANWLPDGRFLTWEPHRVVQIWSSHQTDPQALGEVGPAENQYDVPVSVGGSSHGFIVADAGHAHVLRYDAKGRFQSSVPIPPIRPTMQTGYSGSVAMLQLVHATLPDSAAQFEVRVIESPGDTAGLPVLKVALPWLRIRNNAPIVAIPLFPTLPAYALAPDSDIVWSDGHRFTVTRQSATGALRWSLASEATGPEVSQDELARMRSQVVGQGDPKQLVSFDSSAAHTDKFHAAITGLLLAPDGRVLVVGAQVTFRDSIGFFVLSNTGEPVGRFSLPHRSHMLLFSGDSVLVQRPGANSQQELRWLVLKKQ